MKNKTVPSLKLVAAASLIAGSVWVPSARAQIFYADSFSSANGAAAAGRTPDVTVASAFSGNSYAFAGDPYYGSLSTIQDGVLKLGTDYGLALSFGNSANFSSLGATQFHLALDFNFGTLDTSGTTGGGAPFAFRGIGLGFYSAVVGAGGQNSFRNFYGIDVDAAGNVKLNDNQDTPWAIANVGALSTSATHTISYDVDTITGAISDIVLDGSAVALNFGSNANNLFTGSVINNVGFDANGNMWYDTGSVDNFQVSAVPEPATSALMLIGAGVLALARRRK